MIGRRVMEFEQLRQLVAVKEEGTISAAAEALHISQPALSRSIKRLERDLGQELLDRSKNSVSFNEAGRLAVRHAERILADVRLMRNDFDELTRKERSLKVASVAPAPVWRLTALIVERFPSSILESSIASEREVESQLANRATDFAITRRPIGLPTIKSTPLMTEDLYAYVPEASPLAARKSVSFADLDGQPFLIYENIGFWMDVVRERMPGSRLVPQSDRQVFLQLAQSTDMNCFTTNAPENSGDIPGRVAVSISDADAHATFFLVALVDAPQIVQDVLAWADHLREEEDARA
jgi:DNA-binding transcriptional LysR family regulator